MKCAGLFCAFNRGAPRLRTGAVLELGCCRASCATTWNWPRQYDICLEDYAVAVPRYVCYARRYATTGARFSADSPQLQFLDKFVYAVVMPTQWRFHRCSSRTCCSCPLLCRRARYFNDTCLWRSRQCSSGTRLRTCPVLCTTGSFVVQAVQFWTSVVVPVVAHDRGDASDSVLRQSLRTWRSMQSACFAFQSGHQGPFWGLLFQTGRWR